MDTGIKGRKEIVVTEELAASSMGSGTIDVYATPAMILLIEETAQISVMGELKEGQGTVGTELNVKHLAATPIGMKVFCETELVEVGERRLLFKVEVFDEAGKIGEGTHERFIVDSDKFRERAYSKVAGQ